MRGVVRPPSPAKLVPSPYKQGESAVRSATPQGLLSTLYSLKKAPSPLRAPPCNKRKKADTPTTEVSADFFVARVITVLLPLSPPSCC